MILTPIYLLSMLREIFFGQENRSLLEHNRLRDAEPREIYIISCLLVPIISIGLYPRLTTETYRATIETLVQQNRSALVASTGIHWGRVPPPLATATLPDQIPSLPPLDPVSRQAYP